MLTDINGCEHIAVVFRINMKEQCYLSSVLLNKVNILMHLQFHGLNGASESMT